MKLSCGDQSFPFLPHEAAVSLIAELGFDGLNLVIWGNRTHIQPAEIQKDINGWAGRLDERIRSRGLEIADVCCIPWTDFRTMAINNPDRDEREKGLALFRDMLELTSLLEGDGLTMLPGVDWPHESHGESLARAAEELVQRATEANDRGVAFSIEAHRGSVCQTPADIAQLCELVPGLMLTLDYTHFLPWGFNDADVDPLLRQTRHFHARGATPGHMQAPLKENMIDYERIIDLLRETAYDGYIAVEYTWGDLDDVDVLSETAILRDRLRAKLAGNGWTYPSVAQIVA